MAEAEEDEPLDSGDRESDDAFGVEGGEGDAGDTGGDTGTPGSATPPAAGAPTGDNQDASYGENSPDEKRKKVRYFKELQKLYGLIQEFSDAVSKKVYQVSNGESAIRKNLDFIQGSLQELQEQVKELLKGGIVKVSYTNLVQLFLTTQNTLKNLNALYDFTVTKFEESESQNN